jgi:hypothetical protein
MANDKMGICRNCVVHKFIVVFIFEQVELVLGCNQLNIGQIL